LNMFGSMFNQRGRSSCDLDYGRYLGSISGTVALPSTLLDIMIGHGVLS
jgi:hypothetical protein